MVTALLLLGCGRTPSPPVQNGVSDATRIHVAILGDRTGEPDDTIWRAMVGQAALLRPSLILTVGDLADDSEDEDDWERALAPLRALDIDVEYTPGNHDIHDAATAATFERFTGQAPYRSFDRGGVHWVVVDNSIADDWDTLPTAQQTWLEGDLRTERDTPVVVLMHKPFWATGVAANEPDPMHDLFVDTGVDMVLTGHWHRHAAQEIDGIRYVIIGSSGGARWGIDDPRLGNSPELGWLTVDGTDLSLATLTDGRVRRSDRPSLADSNRLQQVYRSDVRATLDTDGTHLVVTADNPGDVPLRTAFSVVGSEWATDTPLTLDIAPDATAKGRIPLVHDGPITTLPRIRFEWPLPDSGSTPITVVPDWARSLYIPRAPEVTIDADLSEWTDNPTIRPSDWTTGRGLPSTTEPTTVWLGWDDTALLFAARCADSQPDGIKHIHEGRDGQLVYDDRIGISVSPAEGQVYWIYVNPDGRVWDLHADRAAGEVAFDWDATEAAGAIDGDGWTMEARIPWAELGLDSPPDTLRMDLRRKQVRTQTEAVWTPAFGFSDPDRMGSATLVRDP